LDVTNRLSGGNINTRYSPRGKAALVDVGKPIRLSKIQAKGTAGNRKKRLQQISEAVSDSLQDVSRSMEGHWENRYFES
jgi:hypothetical protein